MEHTQSSTKSGIQQTKELKKLPVERLLLTAFLMLSMASLMVYVVVAVLLVNVTNNYKYIPLAIVFLILLVSFYNFYSTLREKILLCSKELTYKKGRKKIKLPLADIQEVRVIKSLSAGLNVRNLIFRMIANVLMGQYQLQITLANNKTVLIPLVAGGGNFISPNVGFSKSAAEYAKQSIDDYRAVITR